MVESLRNEFKEAMRRDKEEIKRDLAADKEELKRMMGEMMKGIAEVGLKLNTNNERK